MTPADLAAVKILFGLYMEGGPFVLSNAAYYLQDRERYESTHRRRSSVDELFPASRPHGQ